MDRLTKKDRYGHWYTNEDIHDRMLGGEPYPHAYDGKPIDKLADYEEFAEIFEKHFSTEALELLSDKEEFSKWLERVRLYTRKCDELGRELQAFKDKQEQGLLIELPVPEGTTVYIFEDDCSGDVCNCNGDCENCASHSKYVDEIEFDCGLLHAWGKWVFATRSEAEEALAKMGGKA